MGSEIFQLSILIGARDLASGNLDRVSDKLRAMGKEGKTALRSLEDLRADLRKGLTIAGVGVGGLMALRGGVKVAGDFEAAIADLRMSIQELGPDGQINVAKLGDELNRFERLGVKLGNTLPGTTQDFIEMFSTLRQGGLDTKTVLDGTGDAVANLAVVTGQIPRDLAEPFAQYAQQFGLTGAEAVKLADVLAKLKFRTGLSPQELIEGSKFFQLRTGAMLGLSGLEGAETSGRVLAALRRKGLEGGVGGRELASMFAEMTFARKEQQKTLAELRAEGISLQFFNKKGQFLGMENAFAQMEKLRKLSPLEQGRVLEKLFSREAVAPANIMIKAGRDGWKEVNAEIDKGASLQEMINQKTETFNAKLESVKGTGENLVATAFTPMLDTLKPILDRTNQIVGATQEWSKAHQTTTSLVTHLIGVGSAAMIAYGGFRTLRSGFMLWRLTTNTLSSEQSLINFLRRIRGEADRTAAGVESASKRTSVAARSMGQRFGNLFMRGAGGAIIAAEVAHLITQKYEDELATALSELEATQRQGFEVFKRLPESKQRELAPREAESALAVLNRGDALKNAFDPGVIDALSSITEKLPIIGFRLSAQPFARGFTSFHTSAAAEEIRKNAPALGQSAVMEEFIRKIRGGALGLSPEQQERLLKAVSTAFPQAFNEASQRIGNSAEDVARKFTDLSRGCDDLGSGARTAASDLAIFDERIKSVMAFLPSKEADKNNGAIGGSLFPSRAMGGLVEREGMVHVHAGEAIMPARVTRGLRERETRGGGDVHIHGGIHVHVPPDARAADDPKALADLVAIEVRRQKERR